MFYGSASFGIVTQTMDRPTLTIHGRCAKRARLAQKKWGRLVQREGSLLVGVLSPERPIHFS